MPKRVSLSLRSALLERKSTQLFIHPSNCKCLLPHCQKCQTTIPCLLHHAFKPGLDDANLITVMQCGTLLCKSSSLLSLVAPGKAVGKFVLRHSLNSFLTPSLSTTPTLRIPSSTKQQRSQNPISEHLSCQLLFIASKLVLPHL